MKSLSWHSDTLRRDTSLACGLPKTGKTVQNGSSVQHLQTCVSIRSNQSPGSAGVYEKKSIQARLACE